MNVVLSMQIKGDWLRITLGVILAMVGLVVLMIAQK